MVSFWKVAGEWFGRHNYYDMGFGPVRRSSRCSAYVPVTIPAVLFRSGGGKVWGTDETNIEGWKALKRLPGHDSG